MLSKEEIEKAKDILVNIIADEVIGTYCIEIQKKINCSENCKDKDCYLTQAIDITLKYIDELESREQKLIEKLEEINTRNAELYNSPKQKEVDFSEWNLAQELLEIYKKE